MCRPDIEAVAIRFGLITGALSSNSFNFSKSNPPFLVHEDISLIQAKFPELKLLLVDLPSVDPESDGGELLAHKAFFSKPKCIGIIEMCLLPPEIQPGVYALSVNMAAFDTDACPCAPILYPFEK